MDSYSIVSSRLALAGLRRPVYSSIAYKHKRTATLVADPRQFRFSFFLIACRVERQRVTRSALSVAEVDYVTRCGGGLGPKALPWS